MEKETPQPDQFKEPIPSIPSSLPQSPVTPSPTSKAVLDDVIAWVNQYRQRLARNPTSSNFTVQQTWHDNTPQTANNFYGGIWLAPFACRVVAIYERHEDNASAACTLQVYKNGATTLLATAFDETTNAGTTRTGSLTSTTANLLFAAGDRLNVGISGSVAGIRGVNIVVEFEPT